MRTLSHVFVKYNEEKRYSDSFFKTQYVGGATPQTLGVGSIKSTLSNIPDSQLNSSAPSLLNERSFTPNPSTPALNSSTLVTLNHSNALDTAPSALDTDERNSTTLQTGNKGLTIVLKYKDHGAEFSDKGFFDMVITILVYFAQADPKGAPCEGLLAYEDRDDYTFSIGPTSEAARAKLPWKLAIEAMGILPIEMMAQGHRGRWSEFSGSIKLDGAYVGKISIEKGDHRLPSGSCGM